MSILSPLRIYEPHRAIFHRFGRHPGLQSKWRTCFAGTSIHKLPTPRTKTSTGIGSSQSYPTCFTPLSTITALKPARGYIRYVPFLVHNSVYGNGNNPHQIPVALAMWNQVGSECPSLSALYTVPALSNSIRVAVLLIRTYAFFNRNKLVLAGLLCALGGMVAYQLYVDTSQMLGKPRFVLNLKA